MDLETRVVKGERYQHPEIYRTEDEINDLLEGYVQVPATQYDQIKSGTHLRYFLKDGRFRSGGWVTINPHSSKPDEAGRTQKYILLRSSINMKGGFNWCVNYEQLSQVWVKIGPEYKMFIEPQLIRLNKKIKDIQKRLYLIESMLKIDDNVSVASSR